MSTASSAQPQGDEDVRYGTAEAPRVRPHFQGEGGRWACENCNTVDTLADNTKTWVCSNCHAIMFTTPNGECPLEKFRRIVTMDDKARSKVLGRTFRSWDNFKKVAKS